MPDTPVMASPCSLPGAEQQPGAPLVFTGRVRSTDGTPVPHAMVDLWQANGERRYSNIHPEIPPFALRGRVTADDRGCFAVRTVRPGAYPLSTAGLVLDLVRAMGRTEHRPAHVHIKVAHPGFRTLRTQVYFPGDPHDETELLGERSSALVATLSDEGGITRADIELVLDPTPTGSAA